VWEGVSGGMERVWIGGVGGGGLILHHPPAPPLPARSRHKTSLRIRPDRGRSVECMFAAALGGRHQNQILTGFSVLKFTKNSPERLLGGSPDCLATRLFYLRLGRHWPGWREVGCEPERAFCSTPHFHLPPRAPGTCARADGVWKRGDEPYTQLHIPQQRRNDEIGCVPQIVDIGGQLFVVVPASQSTLMPEGYQ
jgi:hypothetical protein